MEENTTLVKNNIKEWKYNSLEQVLRKKKEITAMLNGIQCYMQTTDNYQGLMRLQQKMQAYLNGILKNRRINVVSMFKN